MQGWACTYPPWIWGYHESNLSTRVSVGHLAVAKGVTTLSLFIITNPEVLGPIIPGLSSIGRHEANHLRHDSHASWSTHLRLRFRLEYILVCTHDEVYNWETTADLPAATCTPTIETARADPSFWKTVTHCFYNVVVHWTTQDGPENAARTCLSPGCRKLVYHCLFNNCFLNHTFIYTLGTVNERISGDEYCSTKCRRTLIPMHNGRDITKNKLTMGGLQ